MRYNRWLADSTPQIQTDPNTGLLSDAGVPHASPTADVATEMQNLSLLPSPFGPETNDTSQNEDLGKIVWESEVVPLESAPANLPTIEGFLRDEYYTPFSEGTSTTTPQPAQSFSITREPRKPTPTSSPPRR